MSHRLLVWESEKIANEMVSIKLTPELYELQRQYRVVVDQMYHEAVPLQIKAIATKYRDWFRRPSNMDIRAPNGMKSRAAFYKDNVSKWHYNWGDDNRPWNDTDELPHLVSQEVFDQIVDLADQVKKKQQQISEMKQIIVSKLRGRSVKAVCASWPEAKQIIEKMTFSNDTKTSLPVMVSPEMNNLLGLPIVEE